MDLKKAIAAAFKKAVADISFTSSKRSSSGLRAEYAFANGTVAVLACATVQRDFPKGEFGLYTLVSIADGPVFRVMKETHLELGGPFSGAVILAATSHSLMKSSIYPVTEPASIPETAETIVREMKKVYVPIVEGFTSNFEAGYDFVIQTQGKHVRNPFTLALVLLGLTASFDKLPTLIATATKNESFYDFHKTKKPETEIILPVRKWFDANMTSK